MNVSSECEAAQKLETTALVVRSGEDLDELLTSVLAKEGWSIQWVGDNHEALAIASTTPLDLVITGRKTRALEDVELLRRIRSARPHMRLIILTDKWVPGDVVAAMREGAFSYFSAPFEPSAIAEIVRAAVAQPCWDDGIEILSSTPAWVTLMARCDLATADRLVQFLQGVRDPGIPEAERDRIIMAFREILINAIEHGGKFDPRQYVEISFIRGRRAIACRVKDPGQGFSLEEIRQLATNSSPEDLFSYVAVREQAGLRPGGFGMLMAKGLVDELIYNEKGNDVVLVKYLDSPAPPAA